MKKKEQTALIAGSTEELRKEVASLKKAIASQMVSRMTKPTKNVRDMKKMRHRIAVILTAIRQKELNHG